MLCDDLKGWDGEGGRKAQEGGNICIHTADADSLCCAEESSATL